MSKKIKSNFIDLCLRGEVLLEEIDDWVDEWHDTPQDRKLHEYLGMNWAEYSSWVNMPQILPFIITAHKEGRDFSDLLEELQSLPMAARADTKLKAKKLFNWLKAQNII
jgi:hypothetical protein